MLMPRTQVTVLLRRSHKSQFPLAMADGTTIGEETVLPPWGRAVAVPARSAIIFTEAMTRP